MGYLEEYRQIVLVALLFAVILIAWYRWRYVILDALTIKGPLCPKCYGRLDDDAETYRHTVLWTCRECKHTYETLKK